MLFTIIVFLRSSQQVLLTERAHTHTLLHSDIFNPEADNLTRQYLDWSPQGKRRVGRQTDVERSAQVGAEASGRTWTQLKKHAQNGICCRGVVAALYSTGGKQD